MQFIYELMGEITKSEANYDWLNLDTNLRNLTFVLTCEKKEQVLLKRIEKMLRKESLLMVYLMF